jgi:hypothetical protein
MVACSEEMRYLVRTFHLDCWEEDNEELLEDRSSKAAEEKDGEGEKPR